MAILQAIYDRSPLLVQNLMTSVSGYRQNHARYGRIYGEYKEFLRTFDKWPLDAKLEYQRGELLRFIAYAAQNSPFYRGLYGGIDISTVKAVDDLRRLPVVDKEMLRANMKRAFTISRRGSVESHTGGTTGKSLVVLMTKEDSMKRMAMLDHFKERVGFTNRSMRRASFTGKHVVPPNYREKAFWRYNAACKQMLYSSFHLTEGNLEYYVASLNRFKPDAIDGFFSSMCEVASYVERRSLRIEFTPIAIFPTSETLTPAGRRLLERVFHCKVYDQYSSSEGAPFITECPQQVKHIELASGVFEKWDECSDEILVTSFLTHGTPLIRYRIGDSMVFEPQGSNCSCGLDTPLVSDIQGRALDFLYTAEGAKINAGNVSNLFKNMPNAVIHAQVVQNRPNEIIVRLVVDGSLYDGRYDVALRDEFIHKFGLSTRVVVEHVDEIPREKSGKFRFIINNVKQ